MHNITSEQDVSHFILCVNFQKKEYEIKRQTDKIQVIKERQNKRYEREKKTVKVAKICSMRIRCNNF